MASDDVLGSCVRKENISSSLCVMQNTPVAICVIAKNSVLRTGTAVALGGIEIRPLTCMKRVRKYTEEKHKVNAFGM